MFARSCFAATGRRPAEEDSSRKRSARRRPSSRRSRGVVGDRISKRRSRCGSARTRPRVHNSGVGALRLAHRCVGSRTLDLDDSDGRSSFVSISASQARDGSARAATRSRAGCDRLLEGTGRTRSSCRPSAASHVPASGWGKRSQPRAEARSKSVCSGDLPVSGGAISLSHAFPASRAVAVARGYRRHSVSVESSLQLEPNV